MQDKEHVPESDFRPEVMHPEIAARVAKRDAAARQVTMMTGQISAMEAQLDHLRISKARAEGRALTLDEELPPGLQKMTMTGEG